LVLDLTDVEISKTAGISQTRVVHRIKIVGAILVGICKWWTRWPCASTKNLDLVWVWLYKDVTTMEGIKLDFYSAKRILNP
jgi:hypothetical protein